MQIDQDKLKIILFSEGIKALKGVLTPATLIVDCRILKHPSTLEASTPLVGSLMEWLVKNNTAELDVIDHMINLGLNRLLTRRAGKKDPYDEPFTINFFCAHGVHRSVAAKNYIGLRLKHCGWNVEVK